MTGIVAAPTAADPGAARDLRRVSPWLAVLLLPVGPTAVAVLRFVMPYNTVDDSDTIAGKVIAHPDAQSLVIWLGLVATLTLVPAVLWIAGLTRPHAPRLTVAAVLLLVPAYLVLAWISASDLLLWAGSRNGLDATALADRPALGGRRHHHRPAAAFRGGRDRGQPSAGPRRVGNQRDRFRGRRPGHCPQ
jgi:predicted membrane metal-binding protein